MKQIVRVVAMALLVVVLGTGMYVFAEEVYEAVQDIQTEALLEKALESVNPELSPNEAALEATIKIGVELVDGEEYIPPRRRNKAEVDSAQISSRINDKRGVRSLLKSKGCYMDDINATLELYIDLAITYDMTDEENEYLLKLVERGYDLEKLLEAYAFLQKTNSDISYIKSMYDIAGEDDVAFWVETSYELLSGRDADALEVEDIDEYVKQGLTLDEILMAYELSLKTDVSIRDILSYRIDGILWAEVVEECGIAEAETFAGIDDLREINDVIEIAKVTGNNIEDIIAEGKIKEEVLTEFGWKCQEIESTYEFEGIVALDDNSIIEEAKRQIIGVDEATIEKLIQDGYRIREIKEATSKKGRNNRQTQELQAVINREEAAK